MILADGDPLAYAALKRGPVSDYLRALTTFVERAAPAAAPTR